MSSPFDAGPAAFLAALASTFAFIFVTAAAILLSEGGRIGSLWEFGAVFLISVFVFIVAVFHAFAFGLPIYALLPPRWQASFRANMGASFLIGALPMPLLVLLLSSMSGESTPPGSDFAFYRDFLGVAAVLGGLGMVGGFVFWLAQGHDHPESS